MNRLINCVILENKGGKLERGNGLRENRVLVIFIFCVNKQIFRLIDVKVKAVVKFWV